MRRGSYLQQVAPPVQTWGPQLVPSRRWPLRAGEERQAAPADPFASRPGGRETAQPGPAAAPTSLFPRADHQPGVAIPETVHSRALSAPMAVSSPSRPVGEATMPELRPSASLPPRMQPRPSAVVPSPHSAAMREPGAGPERLDPIRVAASARPTAASARRPSTDARAGLDAVSVNAPPRPPAATEPQRSEPPRPVTPRSAEPPARAREPQGPAVRIGTIEVRVMAPVPPAPSVPPASAALSRGFVSPFGLRQG